MPFSRITLRSVIILSVILTFIAMNCMKSVVIIITIAMLSVLVECRYTECRGAKVSTFSDEWNAGTLISSALRPNSKKTQQKSILEMQLKGIIIFQLDHGQTLAYRTSLGPSFQL
jgi:hypothetical protein